MFPHSSVPHIKVRASKLFLALCMVLNLSLPAQSPFYDSIKAVINGPSHDTTKSRALFVLANNLPDGEWEVYNERLRSLTEKNLKSHQEPFIKKIYQRYNGLALSNIAYSLNKKGKVDSSLVLFQKSLQLNIEADDVEGACNTLNNIGVIYKEAGNTGKAMDCYRKAYKLTQKNNDRDGMALAMSNLGQLYRDKGDIKAALDYFHKSLSIWEATNDHTGVSRTYGLIGNVHKQQGHYERALVFFKKAYDLSEQLKDKHEMGKNLYTIGNLYSEQNNDSLAMLYYQKSLALHIESGAIRGQATVYNNIGMIYTKQRQYETALGFYTNALKIFQQLDNKKSICSTMLNIGDLYYQQKNYAKALEYGSRSLAMARELGYPYLMKTSSALLYNVYKHSGKPGEALKMYELFITMKDSITSVETRKASLEQQLEYEYEKKTQADSILISEEKKLNKARIEKEQTKRYALYGGLALVLLFAAFIFNRFKITQKQKSIIEDQKHLVEEKQKEVMDSINYARRLQEAILPREDLIRKHLPEVFILYQPKDIVAGDFYWMEVVSPAREATGREAVAGSPAGKPGNLSGQPSPNSEQILLAAADCTGHGVPGAMGSVVCSNALNRAVLEFGKREPGEILDKTRELVVETFAKSDKDVKDGMDISLVSIHHSDAGLSTVKWSGANNQLLYFKNGQPCQVTAHKQPIGKTDYPSPFPTHVIELTKGDTLYLLTDGFADQFGGPDGKKFKFKNLRELIASSQHMGMEEQKLLYEKSLRAWKGELDQIDDITVIGVKI
jgi:tetratricopeptide (TPR) repeat protein